jgi:hypothetical protein
MMTPGDRMNRAILTTLAVAAPRLDQLIAAVNAEYTADGYGLARFAGIEPTIDRAVASDLAVTSLAGVRSALTILGRRTAQYAALLGPNGKTMPGPDTSLQDHLERIDLDACAEECFRAVGTVLDCLAAAAVLLTGIPAPVQRSEGSWLFSLPKTVKLTAVSEPQAAAWNRFTDTVRHAGNDPNPGWLAWSLEMRNAVVHRGQMLRFWRDRPSPPASAKLLVLTRQNPAHVIRAEQHLRAQPWLPDMHAIPGAPNLADAWLHEPAQVTLKGIREQTLRLVERAADSLLLSWNESSSQTFTWPSEQWRLQKREDPRRVTEASRFTGFSRGNPLPALGELRLHRDSAPRARLADRLYREARAPPRL